MFIVNSVVFILCMFLINKEPSENKIIQGADIFVGFYKVLLRTFLFEISWKAQT